MPSTKELLDAIFQWENKTWEFKGRDYLSITSKMPADVVAKKDREMCFDISSFANTNGGNIVIGVNDTTREIENYQISDKLKNRIANIVRRRCSPVPLYDIGVVELDNKSLTVISINEGDRDLCIVDGITYIRDINGKALATGADITRILKKRLRKRDNTSPTNKDILRSPYNLPTNEARRMAILADFADIAPGYGLKEIDRYKVPRSEMAFPIISLVLDKKVYYFLVVPFGGSYGVQEYRYTNSFLDTIRKYRAPGKSIADVPDRFFLLSLIMGKISSLKSQLLPWGGLCLVPTQFGGYISAIKPEQWESRLGITIFPQDDHKFLLSGIIDAKSLDERLDALIHWLRLNKLK